ncbi:hypothetical protein ACTIVE_1640 [Actinomadura verrucosospora]|uniref:Uncharacterized protein n=1 Tax=Actinomadura verrucosospora TaxID=46165 RepID=A0A7D3ZWC7_ACTVE|nr:hypothetical protein ACTIVE_1640 [Actinomadura verrucosospora]
MRRARTNQGQEFAVGALGGGDHHHYR